MPSFSTTCSARLGLLLLGELARLALVDQGVAAGLGALAAHLVGGDDGDGGVEDRAPSRPRTAAAPRPRRPRSSAGSEPSQAPIRSPTSGWICASSQVSCSGSAKTISPIRARSTRPRARPPRPQRSASRPQQRLGVEQLVDDRVAGDRRRPEPLEGRQRLGLAGRDAAGEADRQRRHSRRSGLGGSPRHRARRRPSALGDRSSGEPRRLPRPRRLGSDASSATGASGAASAASSAAASSAAGSSASSASGSSAAGSSAAAASSAGRLGLRRLVQRVASAAGSSPAACEDEASSSATGPAAVGV